jgi:hypothetical protein
MTPSIRSVYSHEAVHNIDKWGSPTWGTGKGKAESEVRAYQKQIDMVEKVMRNQQ